MNLLRLDFGPVLDTMSAAKFSPKQLGICVKLDSARTNILLDHNKLLDQCNATSAETMHLADAVKDTPISTTLFEHGGGSCEALG